MPHNSFIEERIAEFNDKLSWMLGCSEGCGSDPVVIKEVEEFLRTSLTQLEQETEKRVRESVLREILGMIDTHGGFEDDAGNLCHYDDDLVDTLKKYASSHNINLSKE